jgi:hypothetical protein
VKMSEIQFLIFPIVMIVSSFLVLGCTLWHISRPHKGDNFDDEGEEETRRRAGEEDGRFDCKPEGFLINIRGNDNFSTL